MKRVTEIAKGDGVRVEMEVNGKIIRVALDIPAIHSNTPVAPPVEFDL